MRERELEGLPDPAPGENSPVFRGAARDAQLATDPEWMIAGPSETGKTWAALWRLDALLRATPGASAAMVRKVQSDLYTTVLLSYRRIVERSGSAPRPFGGEKPEWFEYPNGARLYLGGMDRPGKVLSGERDFIYVNQAEELTLADWETLITRTTGRGAVTDTPMLFGDCNPGPSTHWILGRKSLRVLYSKHEDNPALFERDGTPTSQWTDKTGPRLDSLSGARKERLRFGRWVSAEGAVYEEFDRAVHVKHKDFKISPHWRRFRAIDFGFTNPFVCQWWAVDDDGRMYLYREIYHSRRIVEDHAQKILEVSAADWADVALALWEETGDADLVIDEMCRRSYETSVCDHDAEDRATLERHGIPTSAAKKAVQVGIQAVQARLKPAGDGMLPRIFFLDGALVERDESLAAAGKPCCTVQEFEAYAWQKTADGRPIKEEPVKVDDHGMDATRYAVARIDNHVSPGVLWL